MTREEFLMKLKAGGAGPEQMKQALDMKRQQGTVFDDEQPGFQTAPEETTSTYQPTLNTPEQQQQIDRVSAVKRAQIDAMKQETPVLSALFPRQSQQFATGDPNALGVMGAVIGDIFSLPGRGLSTAVRMQGNGPQTSFGKLPNNATRDKTPQELEADLKKALEMLGEIDGTNYLDMIVRDPIMGASMLFAGPLAGLVKAGTMTPMVAGAVEGLTAAGVGQASRIGEGRELSPGEALTDIGMSLALPGFAPMFRKASDAIKKTILKASEKLTNPALKAVSSELSGISQEALQIASTPQGRKKLIEMSEKSGKIGRDLLNMLDNIDDFYKYEDQLKIALDNMPAISGDDIVKSLEGSLEQLRQGPQLTNKIAAQGRIEKELEAFRDYFGDGPVSASDFRTARKDLDVIVNYDKEGADLINSAFKKARREAKDALIKASDGTAYKETMDNYAEALKAREYLYDEAGLGKKSKARKKRVVAFMDNLYNRNNDIRVEAIENIDKVFGKNFSKDLKLSSLAKQMVKGKKIPVFASQTTGRTLRGDIGALTQVAGGIGLTAGGQPQFGVPMIASGLGTFGMSSPKIAPRVLATERGLARLSTQIPESIAQTLENPYIQRTIPGLARMTYRGEQ